MCASNKPKFQIELQFHFPKIKVWCGMMTSKKIGSYFIDDLDTGAAFMAIKERCMDMLKQILKNLQEIDVWFHQDGATCHTAKVSMDWFSRGFKTE